MIPSTVRMAMAGGVLVLAGLAAWVYGATPARSSTRVTPAATTGPLPFPPGFLWGAAIAGHQVESQQASDWTAFEDDVMRNRRFAAGAAFGTTTPGHIRDFGKWPEVVRREKAGFEAHYAEDIASAAAMGLSAFRLSIEWARLFPRADMSQPSPEGIAYYRRVLGELRQHRMTPIVTLFHYVAPRWFFDADASGRRGWERQDALGHWARFVSAVADNFIPDVDHWCTLNEPMVYLYNGYIDGVYPPLEHRADAAAAADVYAALLRAHATAYDILHRVAAERHVRATVGITQATQAFAPLRNWHPADRVITRLVDQAWNWDFLDAIERGRMHISGTAVDRELPELKGKQDFIGINYYTRVYIKGDLLSPLQPQVLFHDPGDAHESLNDMGWGVYPHGLYELLTESARRYAKPVYVLENGTSDHADDDVGRQAYLAAHVREAWLAMHQGGVDLRAYVHWSLLDNFEWVDGFDARLGLIAVDYAHDFRRTPRRSAQLYGEIARSNSLPARYASPAGR